MTEQAIIGELGRVKNFVLCVDYSGLMCKITEPIRTKTRKMVFSRIGFYSSNGEPTFPTDRIFNVCKAEGAYLPYWQILKTKMKQREERKNQQI